VFAKNLCCASAMMFKSSQIEKICCPKLKEVVGGEENVNGVLKSKGAFLFCSKLKQLTAPLL
jgi:hypothetical protein